MIVLHGLRTASVKWCLGWPWTVVYEQADARQMTRRQQAHDKALKNLA